MNSAESIPYTSIDSNTIGYPRTENIWRRRSYIRVPGHLLDRFQEMSPIVWVMPIYRLNEFSQEPGNKN